MPNRPDISQLPTLAVRLARRDPESYAEILEHLGLEERQARFPSSLRPDVQEQLMDEVWGALSEGACAILSGYHEGMDCAL